MIHVLAVVLIKLMTIFSFISEKVDCINYPLCSADYDMLSLRGNLHSLCYVLYSALIVTYQDLT